MAIWPNDHRLKKMRQMVQLGYALNRIQNFPKFKFSGVCQKSRIWHYAYLNDLRLKIHFNTNLFVPQWIKGTLKKTETKHLNCPIIHLKGEWYRGSASHARELNMEKIIIALSTVNSALLGRNTFWIIFRRSHCKNNLRDFYKNWPTTQRRALPASLALFQ